MSTQAHGGRVHEFGIADRLRVAREDAGYDQRRFEEVTGISRGTISNYERGITRPRRLQLAAWALATGFNRDWLETGMASSGGDDGYAAGDLNSEPAGKVFPLARRHMTHRDAWQPRLPLDRIPA